LLPARPVPLAAPTGPLEAQSSVLRPQLSMSIIATSGSSSLCSASTSFFISANEPDEPPSCLICSLFLWISFWMSNFIFFRLLP